MKINPCHPPGSVLRVGMGGFVDGFLFHMILRWRHMISNAVPPVTMDAIHANMLWDGLFHAFTWGVTLAGICMLWNLARRRAAHTAELRSTKAFAGSLVLGRGLFNLVESILNHHLLAVHNVREFPEPRPWNVGFLVIGGAADPDRVDADAGWGWPPALGRAARRLISRLNHRRLSVMKTEGWGTVNGGRLARVWWADSDWGGSRPS